MGVKAKKKAAAKKPVRKKAAAKAKSARKKKAAKKADLVHPERSGREAAAESKGAGGQRFGRASTLRQGSGQAPLSVNDLGANDPGTSVAPLTVFAPVAAPIAFMPAFAAAVP